MRERSVAGARGAKVGFYRRGRRASNGGYGGCVIVIDGSSDVHRRVSGTSFDGDRRSADLHRSPSISIDLHRSQSISVDLRRSPSISIDLHRSTEARGTEIGALRRRGALSPARPRCSFLASTARSPPPILGEGSGWGTFGALRRPSRPRDRGRSFLASPGALSSSNDGRGVSFDLVDHLRASVGPVGLARTPLRGWSHPFSM